MRYCGRKSNSGWLCILAEGHSDEHLSIDNSRLWEGTPGYPIRWKTKTKTKVALESPTNAPENKPKFTGIPCDHCGSMNTVQNGKCRQCLDCLQTGECG